MRLLYWYESFIENLYSIHSKYSSPASSSCTLLIIELSEKHKVYGFTIQFHTKEMRKIEETFFYSKFIANHKLSLLEGFFFFKKKPMNSSNKIIFSKDIYSLDCGTKQNKKIHIKRLNRYNETFYYGCLYI